MRSNEAGRPPVVLETAHAVAVGEQMVATGAAGREGNAVLAPQFTRDDGIATPIAVLTEQGRLIDDSLQVMDDGAVLAALRLMMLGRAFDRKAFSLQRQGRFGTYSPVEGQEASVVGAATGLDPTRDWVVPQYRELPALLHHGLPLEHYILYHTGHPAGGRPPDGVNVLPIQISLAAQLPHAVGVAWGLRLQGSDGVVLVFVGDGASSEGDFHEACNLAGVVGAPVVFFLQNNGWAISTPRARQSAAASLASRAIGYGFPGAVVDGNDLLAVNAVVNEAVQRARAGEGPTLVESVTYRVGPHNTSDDASLYVTDGEIESWRQRDPILRVQRYLANRNRWDDDVAARTGTEIQREIDDALTRARTWRPIETADIIDHVFAADTPRLAEQRAALREEA